MVQATDEALMYRVAQGDSEAFEQLLDRWEGPAKRYAVRMLGDHQVAEDIAQEAFLRVYRGAGDWRPTARFSTWFYTVLGNLCRDRLRHLRRRPQEGAVRALGREAGGIAGGKDQHARVYKSHFNQDEHRVLGEAERRRGIRWRRLYDPLLVRFRGSRSR